MSPTSLADELRVDAPRIRTGPEHAPDGKIVDVLLGTDGVFELALTQYETGHVPPEAWRPFDACVEDVAASFDAWLERQPRLPERYAEAAATAAYVTWSCLVGPRGRWVVRPC